jgi:hypothetical protein
MMNLQLRVFFVVVVAKRKLNGENFNIIAFLLDASFSMQAQICLLV